MFLSLVFVFILSLSIIYYLLKKDDDYGEFKIFPIDYISLISLLFYVAGYILTYQHVVTDIMTLILVSSYISMLFICSYIDLRTKYIYDIVLIIAAIIIFISLYFIDGFTIRDSLLSLLLGGAFYAIIYVLAKLFYKREAFGKGDVLLMGVGSLVLSPMQTLIACFLSFYVAAVVILILFIAGKRQEKLAEIPFGPYICISLLIMFNYGEEIINFFHRIL